LPQAVIEWHEIISVIMGSVGLQRRKIRRKGQSVIPAIGAAII
jgi:hypothetical protein